jgi:osmoprotectant transport system permease protein
MSEQLALLPGYVTAHLQLTLFALLIGTAFSVPAGVLVTRMKWLDQPVLGTASVIQTIPSLALLAIMVPALAALGVQSIGFLPAFIGLTLYSVLPILRNTVTGLAGVDPALVEAARGVGMTPMQRLRRVELPLAMPVILAGIRTSTVLTVGVATLSTPVGAPSLGNYIFSGLQTRNLTAVLVGCVAAAVLAQVLDGLVRGLGAAVARRKRGWAAVVLTTIGLLYGYTGVSLVRDLGARDAGRIVIGAKTSSAKSWRDTSRRRPALPRRSPPRSARQWHSMHSVRRRSTSTSTTPAPSGRPSCSARPFLMAATPFSAR